MTGRIDYERWAHKFAEITEEFVWIHSGSSNGGKLNTVFRNALNALTAYKKQVKVPAKRCLKHSLKAAYDNAKRNGTDPWSAVLTTIAERAEDWTQHISEDHEVTEDIRSWLLAEARMVD